MDVNTTNTTAKKRILALALALILLLLALTRVTLSYFTDTKTATNTFTYGKVSVTQLENNTQYSGSQHWSSQGLEYTNFLPIGTTSTNINDIRAAGNYNIKRVKVQNDTDSNPVYVRVFVRVRKELIESGTDPNRQLVHLDFDGGTNWGNQTYYTTTHGQGANEKPYAVCMYTYVDKLQAGESTTELLKGVYLDRNADVREVENEAKLVYVTDTNGGYYNSEFDVYDNIGNPKSIQVEVATQAVQADAFGSASEAFNATFGSNDPWGGSIPTPNP